MASFPDGLRPSITNGYSFSDSSRNINRVNLEGGKSLAMLEFSGGQKLHRVNVSIVMDSDEKLVFEVFYNDINKGADEFIMRLDIGYGVKRYFTKIALGSFVMSLDADPIAVVTFTAVVLREAEGAATGGTVDFHYQSITTNLNTIAFNSSGELWVAIGEALRAYKYTKVGANYTYSGVSIVFNSVPVGICFDSSNDMWINILGDTAQKYSRVGGTYIESGIEFSPNVVNNTSGIAITDDGLEFFAADYIGNKINRYISSGSAFAFAESYSGFNGMRGLQYKDGHLWIVTESESIARKMIISGSTMTFTGAYIDANAIVDGSTWGFAIDSNGFSYIADKARAFQFITPES